MGKTIWARSLGKHAYHGNMFCIDEPTNVDYAIFDDLGGIQFFPSYKSWLGHQRMFYATDKYRAKRLIDWGKPAIYIANNDPRDEHAADRDWLDANCLTICIDKKIVF